MSTEIKRLNDVIGMDQETIGARARDAWFIPGDVAIWVDGLPLTTDEIRAYVALVGLIAEGHIGAPIEAARTVRSGSTAEAAWEADSNDEF